MLSYVQIRETVQHISTMDVQKQLCTDSRL